RSIRNRSRSRKKAVLIKGVAFLSSPRSSTPASVIPSEPSEICTAAQRTPRHAPAVIHQKSSQSLTMPEPPMRSIALVTIALTAALSASAQTPTQPYPFAPPPGPQVYPHPLTDTDEGF